MKRYTILHNASLGYMNSIQGLRMLRIVPRARQYLTEIQFIIPHLLASGLQTLLTQTALMKTVEKKGKIDL